ncbi:carboxylating nicotinate-nucleotide diphosphorylase [Salidesulfovibrio brasiliensis]
MSNIFDDFFKAEARMFLITAIKVALTEDGADLTSSALFNESDQAHAQIVAKQDTIVAGVPIIPLVLEMAGGNCNSVLNVDDGDRISEGTLVAAIQGPAPTVLKAERVILNFLSHLSGIAEQTSKYVKALDDCETYLLDTRKTVPGLRYPEKYAVRVGGGQNHRMNLSDMLMLKDNHIEQAGSIGEAVRTLRSTHDPCPPVEVECRTLDEVREAVDAQVERIMFDNMKPEQITEALELVPDSIETEISGGITLENIGTYGKLGADFISVGRLTNSAPASDFSMQFINL